MVELMAKGGISTIYRRYKEGVLKREEEGTTGIGEGIAIPHAKTDAVSAPGLATMLVPQGVDYDALDGQPVHMIFLIAAPNTEDNVHLEVLSRLSMLLMDDEFRTNSAGCSGCNRILAHIDEAERKKFLKSTEKKNRRRISRKRDTGYWQLLHVPQGLPTHIWRRKAWKTRRMMFPILAGYIAMALADRPALMPGIVGGLLAKSGMTMAAEEAGWVSSGFFGALIAGFAAGLIMLGLKKILEKLPKALEGTKPMLLYPFLGIAAMGALWYLWSIRRSERSMSG